MKKAAPQYQQSSPSPEQHITVSTAKTKIARILAHLLTGCSLNRFEAEDLGDHCLPSTIADLADLTRHALRIDRQPERAKNRWGKACRVSRYHLPASERDKASKVLVRVNRRGGRTA